MTGFFPEIAFNIRVIIRFRSDTLGLKTAIVGRGIIILDPFRRIEPILKAYETLKNRWTQSAPVIDKSNNK